MTMAHERRSGPGSPRDIEREIERTRERMGVNLDALGEKLSPDHLKQQVRTAVAERTRETPARLLDFIRRRPGPAAAAGLGAALLALRRNRGRPVGVRKTSSTIAGRHPLGFALVAGLVGMALGVMAGGAEGTW